MEFYMPTQIYHEAEAVRKHGEEMAHTGKKALIMPTGHSSSKKNGALKDVTDSLDKYHTAYIIYDKITENPTIESVMDAAEIGRREGTDFVIGIGGGCSTLMQPKRSL